MSRFGYSPDEAEKVKNRLDVDLKGVEYRLNRIRSAVPKYAGATTAALDKAAEIARLVVSDLHDVVDERTEVPA